MKNLIFILLLAVNTAVFGQIHLSGSLMDSETSMPIVGATVYIPKLEKGTVTDLDGKFRFSGLAEGTYDLVISSLGYSSTTIKVEVPSETDLKVLLNPTAIEMEEIIISTPFHQLQSENVMKVERATMKDLARKGGLHLADGITEIAGVQSITTGSGVGKPVIRGLSSNRVLVYTQGIRLENQQFGGEHGLGVSGSGIESVEVIKGPASLLYGSDALGGVLYLNPEKYAVADSTEVDAKAAYFSNTLGTELNAGIKTSLEKFKFLVRGNYAIHSDYETGDGERVTNSRFLESDLKAGVGFRDQNYKGDLRYNFNSTTSGIPTGIGSSTSKSVLEPYQETGNHILSLDNSFYLGNSILDVKVGYIFNERREYEAHHHHEEEEHGEEGHEEEEHEGEEHEAEAHSEDPALLMQLGTLNYDVKYHFPRKGDLETIIGIQGMVQNNVNLGEEFLIPDAVTTDVGILATTHYHLDKIDFQAGIRFDNRQLISDAMQKGEGTSISALDRTFNSYNGALGMKIDLFRGFTSRLNLATGFRAPNLAELTSHGSHHGSNRYEIGNAELENERNYQIDLALELRTDHFEIFGNAFYNSLNNYIYLLPTDVFLENNQVYEYTQNDAALYGGEAGIHIHPHPLDWLHWESSYEMVIGKQRDGTYLPLIPAHSLTNTLRVEFGKNKRIRESYSFLSLENFFQQSRVNSLEEPTAGYSLLSAGLGGNIEVMGTHMAFQISGRNLLNTTYISHLSRLKIDGIANMGRNISLSLQFNL